ncbi:MAG: ParB/RepB/Spo0J family partition protein [Streptococcaceae bacterium]|jgi:ParB family chromosome partitioning protein|nr:ParB/RepB/Spo0J family partition protein [Streptococcaceae bacterium]
METIQMIPLSNIVKNPYQPRLLFDPQKLEELSQSIKENGVLQPIIVRKSEILGYEILAGERRFRASQLAGLTEIPAIVRQLTDTDMMILAILENLQRDDLTVLDEARSLQNLVSKKGLTHAEIADKLGKSRPYVTNAIRILNLPQPVLDLIEEQKISQGHARILLGLPTSQEQIEWAKHVANKQLSVRALQTLLNQSPVSVNHPKLSKDVFIRNAETNLSQHLGQPVAIYPTKIEISYASLEELNRLLHILKQK